MPRRCIAAMSRQPHVAASHDKTLALSRLVTFSALAAPLPRCQSPAMSEKPARILVVDDDPELRALLQRFLAEHGYQVRSVDGGKAMDGALQRQSADVVVLDLMMPGEDGLAILRRLRAGGDQVPVIMLTARGDPVDRVLGLEMGADDYLAKPFLPRELVARIASLLRRMGPERNMSRDETVEVGPLTINFSTMTASRGGTALPLSSREYALLAALARSIGRPLSRAQLIDRALGRDAEVTDRAIDVAVARLRRAIGDDAANPRHIRTVWGVGYVLTGGDDG